MPRLIYSLLFYLAQPLVWLRLLWRARKQPEYLQHLGERYGTTHKRHRHDCSGCMSSRSARHARQSL